MAAGGRIHNLGLTLLSLFLAALLWFVVENETGLKRVDVTLEYTNIPDGLVLLPDNPDTVRAMIRGPESLLPRLRDGAIEARVDLTGESFGESTHLLTGQDVNVPFWAEVERIEPQQITVNLDHLETRTVSVLPRPVGSVARGYVFKHFVVNPTKVTIRGPASIIEGMREVWTEPLVIEGRRESFQQVVKVRVDRPGVLIDNPQEHIVQVVIVPELTKRFFDDVPVVIADQQFELELEPDRVNVQLSGPLLTLERIKQQQLRAVLDVSGLVPREAAYDVEPTIRIDSPQVNIGEDLQVVVSPAQVKVKLSKRKPGQGG